ncbi:MAG: hypothetical protein JO110_25240, partial [Acetobacteraceae bacterium]|nr:hypothetical protein [Acetobacteraceae bacterium]
PLVSLGFEISAELIAFLVTVLITIVVLVSPSGWLILFVLFSFTLSGGGALISLVTPSMLPNWLSACGDILAVLAVSWVVGKAAFGPGRVTAHRIRGAIVLYLNFALVFGAAYRLIAELAPGSFAGLPASLNRTSLIANSVYFSLTTLTTTGFGDIVPVNPFARSLANLEAVMGQLYPATFLARVVTLHIEEMGRR